MTNLIGSRVCGNCKHYRDKGMPNPECHLNPPRTTPVLIGMDPRKGPLFHHVVGYELVQPDFDCSHWAPKIQMQN